MVLPLLATKPVTSNVRVVNFLVPSDESPRLGLGRLSMNAATARDGATTDELIEQAYRQIFFHAFKVDRDSVLEMRLRSGQITVRDFVRHLLLSEKFRNDFYRCNSNVRMVEQVVGRVLGRPVQGQAECIAWSIVIAEQGLEGFVNTLLDSKEYLENFGFDMVPFQRSRVLAGRATGDLPFNQQAPRYDAYWRDISAQRAPAGSPSSGPNFSGALISPTWVNGQPPELAQKIWYGFIGIGAFEVARVLFTTVAAMLSTGAQG
jgi:phycobilisome rod-core linker protein